MVKINSDSRLFTIKSAVLLTQTDTTVGFLSQDEKKLQAIKQRPTSKPFIKVYKDFMTLKNDGIRIPRKYKKELRRAKKTTYIVKKQSFRVAKLNLHSNILTNSSWHYSTSANESGKNFDRDFCQLKADIIIEDNRGLDEGLASKLYKINSKRKVRLR